MKSTDLKPEAQLRSPWTRPRSEISRDSAATLEMSRERADRELEMQDARKISLRGRHHVDRSCQ